MAVFRISDAISYRFCFILRYIFASARIRQRMFGWLYRPILRAVLQCLKGNADAVDVPKANNMNAPVIRPGFQRVQLQQGEESVNPDLHISVESQSALYKPHGERRNADVFDHEPTTEFTTQLPD